MKKGSATQSHGWHTPVQLPEQPSDENTFPAQSPQNVRSMMRFIAAKCEVRLQLVFANRAYGVPQLEVLIEVAPLDMSDGTPLAGRDQNQILIALDVRSMAYLSRE